MELDGGGRILSVSEVEDAVIVDGEETEEGTEQPGTWPANFDAPEPSPLSKLQIVDSTVVPSPESTVVRSILACWRF